MIQWSMVSNYSMTHFNVHVINFHIACATVAKQLSKVSSIVSKITGAAANGNRGIRLGTSV